MKKDLEQCKFEHINNDDIRQRLFKTGQTRDEFEAELKKLILPACEGAKRAGFYSDWKL